MASVRLLLTIPLHLTLLALVFVGIVDFIKFHQDNNLNGGYHIGVLIYLTFWGQLIWFVFLVAATIVDALDVIGYSSTNPTKYYYFLKTRDVLYRSYAGPVGIAITLLFWSVIAVDEQGIFPKHIADIYPSQMNHIQHTLPFFAALLELMLVNHQFHKFKVPVITGIPSTAQFKEDITHTFSLLNAFLYPFLISRYVQGHFAYPFLDWMPGYAQAIFIILSIAFAGAIYLALRKLSRWRWGGEPGSMALKTKDQ
ncbi:hypothetical protein SAMD00019534_052850 [Acytostelium subglobosum LB1]|uniref:hypothetical protein n=1 Tax=Acytostelium subglobosum LB1 TaxID=1410327 RepID=UPI00064506BD|nr:hypothetical protein SAMD00019534_052850 [Acytostelium subglobosum LB1]GAM22110.1 hypothetical protein SAMD00019534_052850 [Acytostelium subglobosum LB1]|eukprot:XP_012755210.1 hypothetical protein SAMD00019534_052850 [Acytostelium subglobosum LB1]